MPEAKPIRPNTIGTALAGTEPRPTRNARQAETPTAAVTMRSQRSGSEARNPPSTMPKALQTMYTLRHMAANDGGTPCNRAAACAAKVCTTDSEPA